MSNPQDPNQWQQQGWQQSDPSDAEPTQIGPNYQAQQGQPPEQGQQQGQPEQGQGPAYPGEQTVIGQQYQGGQYAGQQFQGGQPGQYPGQQYQQPGQQQYGYPGQQFGGQPGVPQPGQFDPNQQYQYPPQGQFPQGQQFGTGQFDPNQPGGFGSATAAPQAGGGKKKGLLFGGIGAGLVVLVAIVIGVLFLTGVLGGKKFDNAAVNDGVKKVLTEQYNASDVSKVTCNTDGVKVKEGNTFDCAATIGGKEQTIKVTVKDSNGTYQVGAPAA
ncbi:DUF4333 domain-containing protein [Tsukamurella sp. 8F]|uniref:DUF4333 domain-containing protein n=1 Tax=unclassified Tsukamurella TaxID=2633480 RepID=UPI0023BA12F4|nr:MULTISPECIES: DUF4333 domain-containing protein [unclassified Tsukamurella]MDF0530554.1 DUF4333 domain-containing protein [Tsukamurella sp. 8J]MDF0586796.1 DUF4333 domain-containing protein [Tsukamurella sp. 8F]